MRIVTVASLSAALFAVPTLAREPEKPVTERDVSAADVATTPVTDLNLKKDEIPALLLAAQERPYTLEGLGKCTQIAAAVGELDAVLGDDIDMPQDGTRRTSAGRVAQSVVGSLIPFRGVIREISGANQQQRLMQNAIQAGIARRSFLKGVGTARGCRYPARSATIEVYNQRMASLRGDAEPPAAAASQPARDSARPKPETGYVSRPVVQPVTEQQR